MRKRFFPILLVLLLCTTPLGATAFQTKCDYDMKSEPVDACNHQHENEARPYEAAASFDTVSPEMISIYTPAPSEQLDFYHYTKEQLNSPTVELLQYLTEEIYMRQIVSSDFRRQYDFSENEVFLELLSRKDCIEAIESFSSKFEDASDTLFSSFDQILKHDCIQELLSSKTKDLTSFKSEGLLSEAHVTASQNETRDAGDIGLNFAGYITTMHGNNVEVYTPTRDFTSEEIAIINAMYDNSANTRLHNPTTVFNCHSYAWYSFTYENPYWINDISPFLSDINEYPDTSTCSQITPESAQVMDIVVYFDNNNDPLHSGVITDINSAGEFTVQSKWGQAGVYQHALGAVPTIYWADENTIRYAVFRYHNYVDQYTGNNLHVGKNHRYQYVEVCLICDKYKNMSWVIRACDGPPCILIQSVPNTEEEK